MNGKIDFEGLYSLATRLSKEPKQAKNFTIENIYVDLLLTSAIADIQEEFDFVLKGGTAIIKTWTTPYRFSYDLDFSFYDSLSQPRKHYKSYEPALHELMLKLGFVASGQEDERHREGGRIYILKLIDKTEHLRIPIKLSVSSIDESPCFGKHVKRFKPVANLNNPDLEKLYQDLPKLNDTQVIVLGIEELCAEKIRALTTRGPQGEWSFLLRDIVDLYVMDKKGILDTVLKEKKHQNCIRKKFSAIQGRNYWDKFQDFMSREPEVNIREEDLSIFFNPSIITEKRALNILGKIRISLKKILNDGI
jgi:predicted nucleotidyltransferase component of viral defense system